MSHRPRGQRAALRVLPGLPSLLRSTQHFPSPTGERSALSLTLYVLLGQVALPEALMGTEAALDLHAHLGPPDLDRHVVDEWRDSLVFIHPAGTEQIGNQASQPHLFTQRTKGARPTYL